MKRLHTLVPLLGVGFAALALMAGCGDEGATCGAGTTEQNGTCVPNTTCGTGTVAMGAQCVPDGTVVCDQGTTFNPMTGECDLDATACAAGTVLVMGQCVADDDNLHADHEEAAEPNEMTGAGDLDVPALNAMTSIHGCISPRAGVRDQDPWFFETAGPALLEVTADGVHGLQAGFFMKDATGNPRLATYFRVGVNLTSDTSKRQVYLPAAGVYALVMDDTRALVSTPDVIGNAQTCYYTTIKQVALPAATPLTVPVTAGTDNGNVKVYSYSADQIADIFDVTGNTTSAALTPAFVVIKNNAFYAQAAATAAGDPPFYTVGGLETTDQIKIVFDAEQNLSQTAQPFTLDSIDVATQPLPLAGAAITATKKNGTMPASTRFEPNFFWFDVAAAGQIVHFNLTPSVTTTMRIARRDIFTATGAGDTLASIATVVRADFTGQYVRFAQPGRYYFVLFQPTGVGGATYTVTSTLTNMTTTPVTYGTPLAAQALPAQGSAFHSLDLTNTTWIQAGIPTAANWGTSAKVTLFDLAGEGWVGGTGGYLALQTAATLPINGTNPLSRVTLGDMRDYLIRVESVGAVGTGPTYTLDVKERPHALLGTAVPGTPIVRTGMDTVAGADSKGFIVFGTAGNSLSAAVTPTVATVDISVERRNADNTIPAGGTINTGAAGAAETLTGIYFAATPNFVAFTVTNRDATPANSTNLSFNVTSLAPRPYTTGAAGTLPYVDACTGTGGAVLPAPFDGDGDDEFSAVQTLPAGLGFRFFGEPVTQFMIGANGLISFGNTAPACTGVGCFGNVTMPNVAAPNGIIAAYWDDLENIRVCRKDEATKTTIQWTGDLFNAANNAVDFQVVLNMNGNIDLIYGAGHLANGMSGNGATVGLENVTATLFNLVAFNANLIAPSTSRTFTPQ